MSAGLGVRRSSAEEDDAVPPLPLPLLGEEEELLGLGLAVLVLLPLLLGPPVPVPVQSPPGARDEVDALLSGVAVACW